MEQGVSNSRLVDLLEYLCSIKFELMRIALFCYVLLAPLLLFGQPSFEYESPVPTSHSTNSATGLSRPDQGDDSNRMTPPPPNEIPLNWFDFMLGGSAIFGALYLYKKIGETGSQEFL